MTPADTECDNTKCRAEANQLPVWPWSRCNCGQWAYEIIDRWQMALLIWPVFAGLILFLIGLFSLAPRVELIGLAMISGWYISRKMLELVRISERQLYVQRDVTEDHQKRYNKIPITPEIKKHLKDQYDHENSLGWRVYRNTMFRLFFRFGTGYVIMLIILTSGPGDVFSWNLWRIFDQTSSTLTSNTVVKSLKKDWTDGQETYLQRVLMNERWLSKEQYNIVMNLEGKDRLIEEIDRTDLMKNDLFNYLVSLSRPIQVSTQSITYEPKNYFQKLREISWFITLMIFIVYSGLMLVLFVVGALSLSFERISASGNELFDKIRLSIENAKEQKLGITSKTPPDLSKSTTPTSTTDIKTASSHLWKSFIGITVAETIVEIIARITKLRGGK